MPLKVTIFLKKNNICNDMQSLMCSISASIIVLYLIDMNGDIIAKDFSPFKAKF